MLYYPVQVVGPLRLRLLLVALGAGFAGSCGLNPQPEPPADNLSGPGAFPGAEDNGSGTGGTASSSGGQAGRTSMGTGGSSVIVGPTLDAGASGPADAGNEISAGGTSGTPLDGSSPPPGSGGTTPAVTPDSGTCNSSGHSDLAGVTIEFPEQPCVFTLAEAAAGITIDYELVVAAPVAGVLSGPMDSGRCGGDEAGGLFVLERLEGGAESYCVCDVGLCAPPLILAQTLAPGAYAATFEWDGKNWAGPSDTGNPKGAPFPPGAYTLTVTSIGRVEGAGVGDTYEVVGAFEIVLVP